MAVDDIERYRFEYDVTLDEYADFNIYTGMETPRAKKNLNKRRILYAIVGALSAVSVIRQWLTYGADAFYLSAAFSLYLFAALFSIAMFVLLSPPFLRIQIRRRAVKLAAKEASVYSKRSVLTFYERQVDDKSEGQEEILQYDKIIRCHIGSSAIYFYKTPLTAYVLPRRVIGHGEDNGFIDFLHEKLSPECFE